MTQNQLEADLAYLRKLAEEGQYSPLLSRPHTLIWGGLTMLALALHWSNLIGLLPTFDAYPAGVNFLFIWTTYGASGWILTGLVNRRSQDAVGLNSVGNKSSNAIWQAVSSGIFIFAGAVTIRNTVWVGLNPLTAPISATPELFDVILVLAFIGYAIAYAVNAKMAHRPELGRYSKACLGASAGAVLLIGDPLLYLYSAIVVAVLVVLPALKTQPAVSQ